MKDIGSIFPIFSEIREGGVRDQLQIMNGQKSAFFALCREAILTVLNSHSFDKKCALLPAYSCQTVIAPFLQQGWKCFFYKINVDLRINLESFLNQLDSCSPSIVVVHPYCGADLNESELDLLRMAKKHGCAVIEDLTQCILSTQISPFIDYYVGSLRKWLDVPDGAFLYGNIGDVRIPYSGEYTSFVQPQLDAMYLRGVYYENGVASIKEISRRINYFAGDLCNGEIKAHQMSGYTNDRLCEIDIASLLSRRLENYRSLFNLLCDHSKQIKPVCRDLNEITTPPLYFPIYAENRSALQAELARNRIYAPVLWPVETREVLMDESVRYIYDHILMLPCDQRYSSAEMTRIAAVMYAVKQ